MADPKEGYNSGVNRNVQGTVDATGTYVEGSSVGGSQLYTALIGSALAANYAALPSGSGKGPDTFIVDLASFGSTDIYLVVMTDGDTVTHTASVRYSNNLSSVEAEQHPGAAVADGDDLWVAQVGNLEDLIPKKDRYVHITLTQVTGTAEDTWAYVVGRELS